MSQIKLIAVLASLLFGMGANFSAWAEKPVRIIVPFPAGGAMDKIARAVAGELAELPTGKLLVENRAGADGLIALEQLFKKSDSTTSVLMVSPFLTIALANHKLPADKAAFIKPVIHLGDFEIFLIASKRSQLKNIEDLAMAVEKPFACAAAAGQFTTICDRLARNYPKGVISVPYRGEVPALNDLLGGHVDFMPITRISAEQHLAAGNAVLLSNLSQPTINPPMSGTSTLFRTPIKSFFGFVVSDDMPKAMVQQLNLDINKILKSNAFESVARSVGLDLVGGSETSFETYLRDNVSTQVRLLDKTR